MVSIVSGNPSHPDPSEILRDLDALQRDLDQTRAGAERAERLETLGTLSGMIAHEFRGIASKIVGNAQLIKRDADDPKRAKQLAMQISRLGLHAGRIAEAILAAAEEPITGACNLIEVHHRSLEALPNEARPRIDDAGIRPAHCAAIDPDVLERVLVNIYLNAWRAVGGSNESGKIRIDSELISHSAPAAESHAASNGSGCSARNMLRVRIADEGPGVHPEIRESVFEPWSRQASGPGHGLGLALCRHLLSAAGGKIRFDEATNQGAAVIIELPASDQAPSYQAA